MIKKSKEALLGVAIGDAVGLGVEFIGQKKGKHYLEEIGKSLDDGWINLRGKIHGKNIEPGYYSDDTEHTIGLVKALIDKAPFSEDLLLEKWKQEYKEDEKRKGFPRQGHGSIKEFYNGKKDIEEIKSYQKSKEDPGNAPVMRAVPLGFLSDENLDHYSEISANSTHPHPKAVIATKLVARACKHVLEGGSIEDIIKETSKFITNDNKSYDDLIKVDNFPEPKELTDDERIHLYGPQNEEWFFMKPDNSYMGLNCMAFKTAITALYILKHSKNTYDGLKKAINMGGDVDSLAAVVTGILAIRYGLGTLPDYMLKEIEGRDNIENLSKDFDKWREKQ